MVIIMPKKSQTRLPNFEAALAELEKIVERMETGDQPLESSLKDFERGMELTRSCHDGLKTAEQRIEILVQKHGQLLVEPFAADESDD